MPNIAGTSHMVTYYLAKKRNIKVISVNDTKVIPYFSIVHCPYNSDGEFINFLKRINSGYAVTRKKNEAKQFIKENSNKLKTPHYMNQIQKSISIKNSYIDLVKLIKEVLSFYLLPKRFEINKIKGVGINHDYRPPAIMIRDFVHKKINKYKTGKISYSKLEEVENFVYYPLQYQPELQLELQGSWLSNQFEVIRMVALSLPGDMKLVVKEHPIMVGLRSYRFHYKIQSLLNTYLVSPFTEQIEIIKQCNLIVNAGGSTVFEAAVLRKPVVLLSMVGILEELPNVVKHTDFSTLHNAIKLGLRKDTLSLDYQNKLINYVSAAMEKGFPFEWNKLWEGKENINNLLKVFDQAIKKELIRQKR